MYSFIARSTVHQTDCYIRSSIEYIFPMTTHMNSLILQSWECTTRREQSTDWCILPILLKYTFMYVYLQKTVLYYCTPSFWLFPVSLSCSLLVLLITGIVVALGCLCLMAEASRRVFASSKNIPVKTVVSKDVVARYQEPTNIIHCRLREGDQWNSTHRVRHTCTLSSRTGLSGGHVEAVVCCFRGPRLGVPARWIGRGGRAATGRCPGADCADENVACASAADHFEYLCE